MNLAFILVMRMWVELCLTILTNYFLTEKFTCLLYSGIITVLTHAEVK